MVLPGEKAPRRLVERLAGAVLLVLGIVAGLVPGVDVASATAGAGTYGYDVHVIAVRGIDIATPSGPADQDGPQVSAAGRAETRTYDAPSKLARAFARPGRYRLAPRAAGLADDAARIGDDFVVVRGGVSDVPPPGEVFSGAAGRTLDDAAAGVPHGQIRVTTAGEIRAGGGTVQHAPELTRSGVLNEKHVNICLGPGPLPVRSTPAKSSSKVRPHPMTETWLPIRYRDFYDVPRAVVVEFRGDLYLFDCLFDHDADDYEPSYSVYRLPPEIGDIDAISWTDLGHRGERIGSVDVPGVEFDTTRREALNAGVFEELGLV